MYGVKGRLSGENWSNINSMITTVHRGGNLLGEGLASRTNPRKSEIDRTFWWSKILFLFFNLVTVKLILSSRTSSGYPLSMNISLIAFNSSSIHLQSCYHNKYSKLERKDFWLNLFSLTWERKNPNSDKAQWTWVFYKQMWGKRNHIFQVTHQKMAVYYYFLLP